MSYKLIRASEIADYVYCRRAWWLRRAEGVKSANVQEMKAGTLYHKKHGRLLEWSDRIRWFAYFLIVSVLTFFLLNIFFG